MIIVVDTGGTKTLIAAFTASGVLKRSIEFPTPKDLGAYTKQLFQSVEDLCQQEEPSSLVVALPGIIKDGVALWCKNLQWENVALMPILQKRYPATTIHIENDANLAGLGEVHMQKITAPHILYLTVSTGIGTGFIYNGELNPSLQRSEGGQMLLEHNGAMKQWEEFASGKAFFNRHRKYGDAISDPAIWYDTAKRLAQGLTALIPLTQPDIIIIGGSMGVHFAKYHKQLTTILDDILPPHIVRPTLQQALQPEQAVVYGGYFYATDRKAR